MSGNGNYRVLALLWLAFAALNAAYSQLYYANTMLEIGASSGVVSSVHLVGVAPCATIISFYAVIMMLVYGRAPKLGKKSLAWLHFVGTLGAVLILWKVVAFAIDFGIPSSHLADSSEGISTIVQQRASLLTVQFRAAIFLFVFSQILFLINLFRKDNRGNKRLERQVLDEV